MWFGTEMLSCRNWQIYILMCESITWKGVAMTHLQVKSGFETSDYRVGDQWNEAEAKATSSDGKV
jgi:hypothetical protein